MLQGIEVDGRAYAGSWFDWLTPYTLLTGLGTVAGYALLGATWLIWKLDGEAQAHARKLAKRAACGHAGADGRGEHLQRAARMPNMPRAG